ncbi:hypothetical protein LCGC14_3046610 [marine sediment metagenome]|uniref:Uncharacterized protein n=1 Tax=marine sediment metagenome TaxID=412755 RepID=A0A0F8WMW7_9ZZZZ
MLSTVEEQFVKELYDNKLKREQVEVLEKEMWKEVEIAKVEKDWDEIQEIKKKYRELTGDYA